MRKNNLKIMNAKETMRKIKNEYKKNENTQERTFTDVFTIQ